MDSQPKPPPIREILRGLLTRGVTRADVTLLMLWYAGGLTYAEIAAVTGVDAGTVAETIDALKAALKSRCIGTRDRLSRAEVNGEHPAPDVHRDAAAATSDVVDAP